MYTRRKITAITEGKSYPDSEAAPKVFYNKRSS